MILLSGSLVLCFAFTVLLLLLLLLLLLIWLIIFFREVNPSGDSSIFHPTMNSVLGSYKSNFVKLNINKTKYVFFSRKSNFLGFEYELREFQTHWLKQIDGRSYWCYTSFSPSCLSCIFPGHWVFVCSSDCNIFPPLLISSCFILPWIS